MNSNNEQIRLSKQVKKLIIRGCGLRVVDEGDGVVIEVFPIEVDSNNIVRVSDFEKGVCLWEFDSGNNLVGCKDVGVCSKNCLLCDVYDDDGNCVAVSCRCTKECSKPPEAGDCEEVYTTRFL